MSRYLAYAFIAIMLFTVVGQAFKLQQIQPSPVTGITLHESRLLLFLSEIHGENRLTYDSIILNISRIRDSQPQLQDYRLEERVVAEKLLERLGRAD
jgi:hypothetical protein